MKLTSCYQRVCDSRRTRNGVEITPTLDTLRKQRTAYMQWTNNSTEIERLSRFKVAYEYCSNRDVVEKGEETIQELKDQKEEMTETIDTLTV